MRKHEILAINKALKEHNDLLRKERDEARNSLNEGITKLRTATATAQDDLNSLHEKADAHAAALVKHGEDLAGLAEAVRASLLAHAHKAEPEPPAAAPAPEQPAVKPPTQIASKRNGKAAG